MTDQFPALIKVNGVTIATTLLFYDARLPRMLFGSSFVQWPAYSGLKGKDLWNLI